MLPPPDPNIYNTYIFGITSKNFFSVSLIAIALLVVGSYILWKKVFASKKGEEAKKKK